MSRLSRIALAMAFALSVTAAGPPALSAAPAAGGALRSATIIAPRWVYLDGDVPVGVRVVTQKSAGRVRAELDLVDSAGVSRWQAVRTRKDLGTATYEYSFFRHVSDIGIPAGTYTLRARVSGPGAAIVERTAQLIVVDRNVRAVPVCVVVRVAGTPADGVPSAEATSARLSASDTADLGRLCVLHPELHLSIAAAPYLLDEWRSLASKGDTSTPGPWSDALGSLRRAAQSGTPVLRGFYSDPDLVALAPEKDDVRRQIMSGDAALAAAFSGEDPVPSVTATGLAALAGPLPESVAVAAARDGITFAVAGTSSVLPADGGPAAPGVYVTSLPAEGRSAPVTMTVLAVDRLASNAIGDHAGTDALAADLFTIATSNGPVRTVVIEVATGPDGIRIAELEESLDALTGLPWLRFLDAPSAAAGSGQTTATLDAHPANASPAPPGYWETIRRASHRVAGLIAAAGSDDPDAARAMRRLLLAESRAWAGADGSWSDAPRGLALARTADESARAVLSKITLDAPAVTLPGSDGKVPVSVNNASGRNLTVVLEASSSSLRIRKARTTVRLKPGENVLTVPVALGTAASGRLKVAVTAGAFQIASSTVTVRASYQDRIVLLAAALLILIGLLFYIRRRVAAASSRRDSGTAGGDAGPTGA